MRFQEAYLSKLTNIKRKMNRKLYIECIELCDIMPFSKIEPDDVCSEYLSQYINPAVPTKRKNNKLSLFVGEQGAGKSAFVASLVWALYDETPLNYNCSLLCYDAIKRCDEGKTTKASVSVYFNTYGTSATWSACKEYIKTQGYIHDHSQVDYMKVIHGNAQKIDLYYESYVPRELKDFLFYDGEKLLDAETWKNYDIEVAIINLWQNYLDSNIKGEKIKKHLEKILNKAFSSLCIKNYYVELDKYFAPRVFDRNRDVDLTNYLSINDQAAIRLAYALTLSKYVSSMQTKIQIPLILDNPFSQMNVETAKRAARVINKYAPQIFVFLTYSDIENKIAMGFQKYCGALFELQITDCGTEVTTKLYRNRKCITHNDITSIFEKTGSNDGGSKPIYNEEQNDGIEHGSKYTLTKSDYNDMLSRGAKQGNLKASQKAIANGADLNCTDDFGFTPLVNSIINNKPKVFHFLVKTGADMHFEDKEHCNALMFAANEGKMRYLKYMIKHGADINHQNTIGYTPLMLAVVAKRFRMCIFLLKHGADKNIKNCLGNKAIETAIEYAYHKIVALLSLFNQNTDKTNYTNKAHVIPLFKLGYIFSEGIIFKKNINRGVQFYKKAASYGDTCSQVNLAYIYEKGEGVDVNYKEAEKWYLKAAERGDTLAQNNLGMMYRDGKGVEHNLGLTMDLFRASALHGNPDAQVNLGGLYFFGKGVEANYNEAFKWYLKAAEQGDETGQFNIGIMYEKGLGIALDHGKAFEMYMRAARSGHIKAQVNLSQMFSEGRGTKHDKEMALFWCRIAYRRGDEKAE